MFPKGSAGDDMTNQYKRRNWGPLDGHNEIGRTNEYTYNNITIITIRPVGLGLLGLLVQTMTPQYHQQDAVMQQYQHQPHQMEQQAQQQRV